MVEKLHQIEITVSEARLLIEAIEQHFYMAGEEVLSDTYEKLKEVVE